MKRYNIIKLKNITPVHISVGKDKDYDFAETILHSDVLSSALAAIRVIFKGKDDDVKEFLSSFALSSAYPFRCGDLFLPKPLGRMDVDVYEGTKRMEEVNYRKRLKKLKFLHIGLWNDIIQGMRPIVDIRQINGEFLFSQTGEQRECFRSEVVQRVSVAKNEAEDNTLFFFERRFFSNDSGLYVITDAEGELFDELFELFELLGQEGIGSGKSIGGGQFEVERDTVDINAAEDGNAQILLSMYLPQREEMEKLNLDESVFEIALRGGFMAGSEHESLRHLRKKSIYMFKPSSIFATCEPLCGKVEDLRPEYNNGRMHAVYRSGKPLFIPIKRNVL